MEQLKCTTANCIHNLKSRCNATIVGIDEKGRCATKMKRVGGALEQTFAELEAGDEIMQEAPSIVQCDARCIYNRDNRCGASSILVKDKLMRTKCETRIVED
ncbi:MAG: DUF1540 domain-containing protein [Clostridia bacterium]|nr:DUF1540 domain-containing protein [Clostridia bacterium]